MADNAITPAPEYPQPEKSRSPNFSWLSRDKAGVLLIRGVLPAAIAFTAYELAGEARANLGTLQNLMQLAITLIAGVAAYTIITEFTLERLPGQLSKELEVIADELRPIESRLATLANTLSSLTDAVNDQLGKLIDMHGIEVLFAEGVLDKAEELQAHATHRVEAVWAILPYDDRLQKYFTDTLLIADRHTSRIVAACKVEEAHLIDHITETWQWLVDGRYELYLVPDCNYEVVVTDGARAGLFIYSKHGFESCCLSSTDGRFVDAVEGLVHGFTRSGQKLPIGDDAPSTDLAHIVEWVHNYYTAVQQR